MNEDRGLLSHKLDEWVAKSSDVWDEERFELLKKDFGPDLRPPVPEDFGLDSNDLSKEKEAYEENLMVRAHNQKNLKRFTNSEIIPIIGPLVSVLLFWDKKLNPLGHKYEKYLKKLDEYNKTNIAELKEKMRLLEIKKREEEYWFSLDGWKFEEEVSKLFLKSGQCSSVVKTKGSGDGGVDLILTANDGTKILVQCKAHKKEVGPHVARDLYGAMHSAEISSGLIISLGGFTQGVRDFISGKDIKLFDVGSIIKLQKKVSGK